MKENLKSYLEGMKSILTRNVVLVILINTLNQYSNLLKNSYRSLFAVQELGVSTTVFGTAISFFLVISILCRIPSGSLIDHKHSILKYFLTGAFLMKAMVVSSFLLIKNAFGLYCVFLLDAIAFSFLGIAMPAILAISIDNRIKGSAYAIMMGVSNILCAHARSLGISLYNTHGLLTVTILTASVSVLASVLCCFLDSRQLVSATEKESLPVNKKAQGKGILIHMLPLACIAAMPIIMYIAESNFLALYAKEENFTYLGTLALAGTIDGINTIIVGFLCDVINPVVFIVIGLFGCVLGNVLFSAAHTSSMFCLGIFLYYFTQNYDVAFRIIGMKLVSKKEQGSLQATMLTCNEILSVACAPLVGFIVQTRGYRDMWSFVAAWIALSLITFLILYNIVLKKRFHLENS